MPMMKSRVTVVPSLIALLLAGLTAGCSPKQGETLVASVGDDKITLGEYERLYVKSNGSREAGLQATMEEREKFLDLMVKYRLKLADAYTMGLDKDPSLMAEVGQYKGSLAASYLTERDVTEPGLRRLYQRRSEETRASHILLSLGPNAAPEDTVAAYAKAAEVIGLLDRGAPFDSLAVAVSQDPSAATNRGDLYYFTAGQMVSPFEDAVYAMKKGDVTRRPVRTQYGLHIIKLTDRKPSVGQIQAGHIMIRFDRPDPPPADTAAAFDKARALLDSLRAGAEFGDLARRHSGDPGSAGVGGDLGVFGRRRWIQEFDEVAFNLQPGQVSDIVRTRYGYHIIKCTAHFPLKSFDESKAELKTAYQQTRFQDDFAAYVETVKRTSGYTMDAGVLGRFTSSLDSTRSTRDSAWWSTVPTDVRSATLYTIGGRAYPVDSLIANLRTRPDLASTPLRGASLNEAAGKVGEQFLFTQRAERLEKESPEFAAIMREYREGILLYQVEQERVWKRVAASVNDSTLKAYHAANADRYRWPSRVAFSEAPFTTEDAAAAATERLKAGASLEDLAREEAVRMAAPTSFTARFARGSVTVSSAMRDAVAPALLELRGDAAVRLQFTAQPDTLSRRKQNIALADRRLAALRKYVEDATGAPPHRITTAKRVPPATGVTGADRARLNDEVLVDVLDRRPLLPGGVGTQLLPDTTDERTRTAAALAVGAASAPFAFRSSHMIVRLDRREPARTKTFEECTTEVSSAFQDFESRRLESEWIEGLKKRHPVEKRPQELQKAFAPAPVQ